jgi:hypothetical protein
MCKHESCTQNDDKRLQINNFMFSLQTPSNGSFQPQHLCLKLCKRLQRSAVIDGICSSFVVSQWGLNFKNTQIRNIHKNTQNGKKPKSDFSSI